ncbi:MAG: tRNA-dihydrouridine synthase, partial [Bdellovibrionales bacterium]
DHATRNTDKVAQVAHDEGVTWVAIHGRTRAAAYTGLADWEYIRDVKRGSPVPVLGNGDISSAEVARSRLSGSGCDGVMIGRGCLKNPRIFRQARGLPDEESSISVILARLHTHLVSFYEERMVLLQMRKFASWYSAGYPGAAQFRKDLFSMQDGAQVLDRIDLFYDGIRGVLPTDTSREAFLMGGHG